MIEVPENTQQINPNAKDDGIQLPFVAPIFYWRHGDARFKEAGSILYFGGWETQEDDLFLSEFGEYPKGLTEVTHSWGSAMGTRQLIIAPIRTRKRWTDRSHSQTLCLVGGKSDDGKVEKIGVAVLSAKGWTTKYLSDAIRTWNDHTADARRQWASYESGGKKKTVPSWYFWMLVGTFGEFSSETVGTGKNSSTTTQPQCHMLTIGSKEQLESLYVGKENYALMSELYAQSEEWANDERWQKGEEQIIEAQILPRSAMVAREQAWHDDVVGQEGGGHNEVEQDDFPW
jgi:hypothetical protein